MTKIRRTGRGGSLFKKTAWIMMFVMLLTGVPLPAAHGAVADVKKSAGGVKIESGNREMLGGGEIRPTPSQLDPNRYDSLKYLTKSNYSAAGTRWRTVAMTVEIRGGSTTLKSVIPTKSLNMEFNDELKRQSDFKYGVTYEATHTIDKEAIFSNCSQPDQMRVLWDRASHIKVGAHIEAYNASSGTVIKTYRTEADIQNDTIFDATSRQNMLSRFKEITLNRDNLPDYVTVLKGQTPDDYNYASHSNPGVMMINREYKPGEEVRIEYSVFNARWAKSAPTVSTSLNIAYWGQGTNPLSTYNVPILSPGGRQDYVYEFTVPALDRIPQSAIVNGYLRLVFMANPHLVFTERNVDKSGREAPYNNMLSVNIKVSDAPPGTGIPDGKKEYLSIVPYTQTLFKGEYYRFKAFHHKTDGSSQEVTTLSDWNVSDNNIARLSPAVRGELWGVKEGVADLKAQYKGMEAVANVMVIPKPIPPPPNYKPKADFVISNSSPVEGEKVFLRDISTHEGKKYGEEIVSWEWDIEKQSGSSNKNTEVTWNEVGTYKITLRVEDQDGDSDSCTKRVVVGPALPAAVITTSSDNIILGREIHIDGDESTAAMDRDIKWDEMEWKFYGPDSSLRYEYTGRYPLGKGNGDEKTLTNSVLNQIGIWKIRLKVKDTNDNESEVTEKIIQIHPDQPPRADFWLGSEAIRNSYQGYYISVRDLSVPEPPDGSLGDEICERIWTLYYDANNDGNCKGTGDEVICPGDKGKAAEIIQKSGNDPEPIIKFFETGRYQLELTVKECYEAWGEINEGLPANTEGKASEEKQLMVINLAPTVAFDIKKKMPADILFAADYTVQDTKYNSLLSSQAGFISELESGFVAPEVVVKKVNVGELGLEFFIPTPDNPYDTRENYRFNSEYYDLPFIRGSFNYVSMGGSDVSRPILLDYNTERILDNVPERLTKLNDGTYLETITRYSSTKYQKRSSNLHVIISQGTYDNAFNQVLTSQDGWDYEAKKTIANDDGSFIILRRGEKETYEGGKTYTNIKYHVVKINSNLQKGWEKEVYSIKYWHGQENKINLEHYFPETDTAIVSEYYDRVNSHELWYWLVSPNTKQQVKYFKFYASSTERTWKNAPTTNGKYYILARWPKMYVINGRGQEISSPEVGGPTPVRYDNRCVYIGHYKPGQTAVMYGRVEVINDSDHDAARLFIIDNNTGAILKTRDYVSEFYGDMGSLNYDRGLRYDLEAWVPADGIVAVQATKKVIGRSRDDYYFYTSLIGPSLDKIFKGPERHDIIAPDTTWETEDVRAISDEHFIRIFEKSNYMGSSRRDYWVDEYIYNKNGTLVKTIPTQHYPYTRTHPDKISKGFPNGDFCISYNDKTEYYSANGVLKWTLPASEGKIINAEFFMNDFVVTSDVDEILRQGNVTKIVNSKNGRIVNIIPYPYLYHNSQYIICGDYKDYLQMRVLVFYQLQDLEYLEQAIQNHTWDANMFNVVVSVMDGNSYKDFEEQRAVIQSLLQANNLKLAVISPSTGLSRSQAEQLIAGNPAGGWWIQTAGNMSSPVTDLAKKIIQAVNEDRGADNIVLVGQETVLRANYQDPEQDSASKMIWSFTHDPERLDNLPLVKEAGVSTLHNTSRAVLPAGKDYNILNITFDQPGTYWVYCKAQDLPNTTDYYRNHTKAGNKWSNQDAYITVIAHCKPKANFTINNTNIYKNTFLSIADNSFDPDLYDPVTRVSTDPLNQKGLRSWQWQYKKPDRTWESYIRYNNVPPAIYTTTGVYQVRLRVQDVFGAWSDWTEAKTFNVVNRPPIADFIVNPNPTFTKLSTTIADKSRDPDGEPIVEYRWEIQKASGETDVLVRTTPDPFGYTWEDAGTYKVKLTVKDPDGATGMAEKLVVVNEARPPIARVSVPGPAYAGETSLMDGRASTAETPGSTLVKAYWQYKKPGRDWSDTHIQVRGESFHLPEERWLVFPVFPADNELGQWTIRLVVEDSLGQFSAPVERPFTVVEGWEITGQIIPEVGERGRYMIIAAYAHRKGKPDERYQIDSMKAELAYLDPACTQSGRAVAEGMETLNMPYNASKADFRVKYLVGQKVYQNNRWPADGAYHIKVVGQKGITRKEVVIPWSIKGNIYERFYIQTRSW